MWPFYTFGRGNFMFSGKAQYNMRLIKAVYTEC